MHSPDLTAKNIAKIRELFPNCVTEATDENGKPRLAVDFDQLRQELSDSIVEGAQERYRLDWPGKRAALLAANAPIAKTLRPCREESLDFDSTQNLFIEGDNLDALKLLQETYLGKVKMIYIDPPYNTGKDFIYKDNFTADKQDYLADSGQIDEHGGRLLSNPESNGRYHSDWLSMMYPRLKLARNLLRDDGVIFISIDDNEVASLRKICSEIFGDKNFIAELIWERAYAPKNDAKYISNSHDYVLMYAKSINAFQIGRLPRTEKANARYKNLDNDPRGVWKPSDMSVKSYTVEYDYPITTPSGRVIEPPTGRCWRLSKNAFLERLDDNRIYFGVDGNNVPCIKRFLSELKFDGLAPQSIMFYKDVGHSQEGAKEVTSLLAAGAFDGPKPIRLLNRLISLAKTEPNDIILDFFAGSSSTAHATMQLNAKDGGNRKFIMVQLPEETDEKSEACKAGYKTIAEIAKERIRRAGKKILAGECHENWNKDIGFRVLKIDSSNMADVYYTPEQTEQKDLLAAVDNIKPGRGNPEDLLFQVLVDWGVDLTLPIHRETIQGKTVFFINHKPYDLIACFDQGITEQLVKELAAHKPVRVVFRDNGFASDAVKINVEQIFRQLSPATDVKSI